VYERTVGGNLDVFVVPASGGAERRLTRHPAEDALPRWTPDGRAVIFSSRRSGSWQLWEAAPEGGEPRRLRENAHTEYQADPSPDGGRIAFLSDEEGRECLWVMERGSGASRLLVRHGRRSILGNPHWSPDGGRIVFSSNWKIGHQVYVLDVTSGAQTRVSAIASGGCEPRFSRDGRKVAYVNRGHFGGERSTLVEHDLATGEEKVLVDWPALNYDPVYSPDATEIAFASDVSGEYAIYRQRLSDGKSWRVTFGPGPARHPDYRPRSASR
jgi:Tol biopolymer transport system component